MYNVSKLPPLLLTMLVIVCSDVPIARAAEPAFHGDFVFRWLSEPGDRHREMESINDVSFFDGQRRWDVPKGTRVDGASIPPFLWSFAGSPFVGNYRRASAVHDHFCTLTVEPPSAVHWMFYQGMRADGIGLIEARSKYAAVSAYSWLGGSCAGGVDPVTDLQSLGQTKAFAQTAELLNNVQKATTMDAGEPDGLREFAKTIVEIADVKKKLSYDALVEFRLSPDEANFELIQHALELEQTTPEEIRELSTLINAVIPTSRRPLPKK